MDPTVLSVLIIMIVLFSMWTIFYCLDNLFEFVEEFQDRFNSEVSNDDILQLCIKK